MGEDQKTEILWVRKSGPLPVGSQQVEVQRHMASKAVYQPVNSTQDLGPSAVVLMFVSLLLLPLGKAFVLDSLCPEMHSVLGLVMATHLLRYL